MPDITKRLTKLLKTVDKLIDDTQRDINMVIAAGKEIKDSLPKRPDDEKHD